MMTSSALNRWYQLNRSDSKIPRLARNGVHLSALLFSRCISVVSCCFNKPFNSSPNAGFSYGFLSARDRISSDPMQDQIPGSYREIV